MLKGLKEQVHNKKVYNSHGVSTLVITVMHSTHAQFDGVY